MKRISLSGKLIFVLAIASLVTIVVFYFGMNAMIGMNQRLNGIVDVSAQKIKLAARINQDLLAVSRAEKNLILAKTQEEMDQYAASIEEFRKEMQTRRTSLRELADDAEKASLDEFGVTWDKYLEVNQEVKDLSRLNSNANAMALSTGKAREQYETSENLMKEIAARNDADVTAAAAKVKTTGQNMILGARMVQDLLRVHRAEKNVILEETQAGMREYADHHRQFVQSVDKAVVELKKSVSSENRSFFDNFTNWFDRFKTSSSNVINLALAGNSIQAKIDSTGAVRNAYDKAEKALQTLVDYNTGENTRAAQEANDSARLALLSAMVVQDMLAIHRAEKSLIGETTQEGMDVYAAAINSADESMKQKLDEMTQLASEEGKTFLGTFRTEWDKFMAFDEQVRSLSRENGNTRAFDLASGKGRELADKSQELMAAIVAQTETGLSRDKAASDKSYASARNMMITIGAVGILFTIFSGLYLIRSITRAFKELFQGLKSFSNHELNETSDKFKRIIEGLTSGSEQVSSAAGQVSSASQSLAEGASEQAASIEETSSSLEEMSSMTKTNAENATQADNLMKEANKSMEELTLSMEATNKASEETGKIIKTIDEIAFQTNLLALNAAVEAARAGEAGAGFAVVADEVRNLAMRAAEAAKNTSVLIEDTVKRVRQGSEIVTVTNEKFDKVAGLVAEISAASDEQATGIEQINTAVAEMDKVIQQNASSSEESASASEELSAQAEEMMAVVNELMGITLGTNGNGTRMLVRNGNGNGNGKAFEKYSANRVTRKTALLAQAGEVTPEQVIPMDEDNAFKNF